MPKVSRYVLFAFVYALIYAVLPARLFAQNNYKLLIIPIDKDSAFIANNLALTTVFKSRSDCNEYVTKLPSLLSGKGYISSSLDSVTDNENQTIVYLFTGEHYSKFNLRIRDADKPVLRQAGVLKSDKEYDITSLQEYREASEKLLDYFENNGYPFSKITLDSVAIQQEKIEGVLHIDKGFPYHIDSIRLYGSAKISHNFMKKYLDLERGEVYNREKLDKINQRLLELPYIEQLKPWDLTMLNTGSLVNLYLEPKKSNQINVLAGFLPSNQQLGGKLLLTVDANLQLQNAFGGGENVGLLWQQIQPKSPRLHLNYTQPYLFNSPFGVDFLFDLFKKDSAFLNINGQLGLLYMVSPNKTAKVILQSQQTSVLQVDTASIRINKRLPDIADVSSLNLGIDFDLSNTDYRFNPRRGNEVTFSATVGNKTIKKNNAITQIKDPSFDYNTLYDTLSLKTYQIRLKVKAAEYLKTGKLTVLKTALNAGWFQSPSFFRNELFQIGGYRLLRGFDEESIFANQYAVGTLEYRYLAGLNSNFFVFTDLGWSSNRIIHQSNSYIGAGIGLSIETKGGIFNISYAVGKRNDLNFDIKQSKIHFGYVSIF